jgi:hypothetical protein
VALTLSAEYFEDEDLLDLRPLDEVLSRARARACVDAEELASVESTRPTMAVFLGEPWR